MQELEYFNPETKIELLSMIASNPSPILAGGTDLIPAIRRGKSISSLIDISKITSLKFIEENEQTIRIGTLTTHADIQNSEIIQRTFPALSNAASSIGCIQTRQRGTIGGNLVNASPAADLAPVLLALNAFVAISSAHKNRQIPLSEFWLGNKQTVLQTGELLEAIEIPKPAGKWALNFEKLGKRKGMSIAIASVAIFLSLNDDDSIQTIRVALGSVAAKPIRAISTEMSLINQMPNKKNIENAAKLAINDISPIDDIRATASYRQHACKVLVAKTIESTFKQLCGRAL